MASVVDYLAIIEFFMIPQPSYPLSALQLLNGKKVAVLLLQAHFPTGRMSSQPNGRSAVQDGFEASRILSTALSTASSMDLDVDLQEFYISR